MQFMNDISKNSLFLPEGVKIDFEKINRPADVKAVKWEKNSRGSRSSFSGCGSTGLAKYIKNYWPPLEVTPIRKTRSSTGLLVLNQATQVAKTSGDLEALLQIWQSLFACSYKIVLSPVCVCFHNTSVSLSVLQL
jgi:hypothetical protein